MLALLCKQPLLVAAQQTELTLHQLPDWARALFAAAHTRKQHAETHPATSALPNSSPGGTEQRHASCASSSPSASAAASATPSCSTGRHAQTQQLLSVSLTTQPGAPHSSPVAALHVAWGPHSSSGSSGPSSSSSVSRGPSAACRGMLWPPSTCSRRSYGSGADNEQEGVPASPAAAEEEPNPARDLTRLLRVADSPQQLLQLLQDQCLEQQGGILNGIHVAAAYTRLGQLCQQDPAVSETATAQQLLQQLSQLLPSVEQKLRARELSNIIFTCSCTQQQSVVDRLLPLLLQSDVLAAANAFDISSMLGSLASMGLALEGQQLHQVLQQFVSKLQGVKPQHIARLLRAVASMQQQVPVEQAEEMVAVLLQHADTAEPQHISISLWALGKMGCQALRQVQDLLAALVSKQDDVKPHHIASSLLGVAYLKQQVPEQQLHLLLIALGRQLDEADTQAISNSLWAVATMGQRVPDKHLQLWLVAIARRLHQAKPQEVAITLWACAELRYAPLQFLMALQQQPSQLHQLVAAATAQNAANMAWACAQLGLADESKLLLQAVLQRAMLLEGDHPGGSSLTSQALCNLCLAVAVLNLQEHVPEVLRLAEACVPLWGTLAVEHMTQLYQVHLWLQDCKLPAGGGGQSGLSGVLSKQQLDECCSSWEHPLAQQRAAGPSKMQQDVVNTLLLLPTSLWQQPPALEQLTADGGFSVDIVAVTAAGVRLAVELVATWHVVAPENMLNGCTQFRHRALKARGYEIVSVPYWEWVQKQTPGEREEYLLHKLAAYLPPAASQSVTHTAAAVA